jgi:tripartite-type tricarboxylate transporter receptor subunit TctC
MPAGAVDLSGERIEAIVPFAEGGGGDSYTRYMAKVLAPKLQGEPTIVIRNVPGGGSVVGANYFQTHSKPDGTSFAVASTSTTLTYAMRKGDPEIAFEADKWIAFVASPVGRVIYINADTGVKNLEDLKALGDKELLIGLQSPTGSDMPTLLSFELLGVNAKPVFGVDGGDAHLAFQRGEFQLNGDVTPAYLQMAAPLVKEGKAYPLFTFGYQNESGEIVRDPNFPELPTFIEAYKIMRGEEAVRTGLRGVEDLVPDGRHELQGSGAASRRPSGRGGHLYAGHRSGDRRPGIPEGVRPVHRHLSAADRRGGSRKPEGRHHDVTRGAGVAGELAEERIRRRALIDGAPALAYLGRSIWTGLFCALRSARERSGPQLIGQGRTTYC